MHVKAFLSSPQSLEPVEPEKSARKRRTRRTAHSKCILAKSIYEETDLSKLTARQRILHQRFQERRESASSFFLVSNNISTNCRQPVHGPEQTNIESTHVEIEEPDTEIDIRDIVPESPFEDEDSCDMCKDCFYDGVQLYNYLERSIHRCSYEKLVMVHKARIRQSLRSKTCLRAITHEISAFAHALASAQCCNSNH